MTEDLQNLEDRRDRLYQKLPSFGDFRLGIISETYTRCGKKNCACAHKDHPGHGPRYLWNTDLTNGLWAWLSTCAWARNWIMSTSRSRRVIASKSGVRRRWNSMKGSAA